jgi:hypothetical protein
VDTPVILNLKPKNFAAELSALNHLTCMRFQWGDAFEHFYPFSLFPFPQISMIQVLASNTLEVEARLSDKQ